MGNEYRKTHRSKDLRSAEADLRVIVGKNEKRREVFWHYRQVLALQSGYIDTVLSTLLPTSNDLNDCGDYTEIVFSDIKPSQWKRMVRFLRDPYSMTVADVFELVALYDQYDFQNGLNICDGVLLEKGMMFDFNEIYRHYGLTKIVYFSDKVDRYVQNIVLSYQMGLKKTFHWGRVWLKWLFEGNNGFPLRERHLIQLIPIINMDDELPNYKNVIENGGIYGYRDYRAVANHFDEGGEDVGICLKESMSKFFVCYPFKSGPLGHLELAFPLTIDWLAMGKEPNFARKDAPERIDPETIECITIDCSSGPRNKAFIGSYYCKSPNIYFHTKDSRWEIVKSDQWVLKYFGNISFVCRHSEFALVPPTSGWVSIDGLGEDLNLKVDYVWKGDPGCIDLPRQSSIPKGFRNSEIGKIYLADITSENMDFERQTRQRSQPDIRACLEARVRKNRAAKSTTDTVRFS
mmetsp:Transcript_18033/g.44874  ORF Transcript_18033/g.44874 Transcript_18033/m.44874 type:complete len:461 (+) Transcript_18033:91-1473(+)